MTELAVPLAGVDGAQSLRAQNLAFKVQLSSQEREIVQLKHALDLALSKGAGLRQRVVLNKPLGQNPERMWQDRAENSALQLLAANESSPALVDEHRIISTLESQLEARNNDVAALNRELSELRERSASRADSQPRGASNNQQQSLSAGAQQSASQHLMLQIQFLHSEVERLEGEVDKARGENAEALRAANIESAQRLRTKDEELQRVTVERNALRSQLLTLQRRTGVRAPGSGEDLHARCRTLEAQLSAALSEKNAAVTEKFELLTKVRRLEASNNDSRKSANAAERFVRDESVAVEHELRQLRDIIAELSLSRDQLMIELEAQKIKALSRSTHSSASQSEQILSMRAETQTLPPAEKRDGVCQVNTIQHFADVHSGNLQSIAHSLEQKCAELDEVRGELDQLSSVHKETLEYFERTKERLGTEMERRKVLEGDCEKLSLQVRALQQQASQTAASLREKQKQLEAAERHAQEALNARLRLEEERVRWEQECSENTRDMQHLVANQTQVNAQVNALSSENEQLRDELQKMLQRELQVNFSLRAKEAELGDLLRAYQQAVHEGEQHMQARRSLEREVDNMRATVASKEERIVHMMEQIHALHAKEQQLSVDLQAFDFESSQLHRKLVQIETNSARQQAQSHDMQQSLQAAERVNNELERNLAELSKQLVVKDNECLLLRHRCDNLEHDCSALSAARMAEGQRLRELEESNARLAVRHVVAAATAGNQSVNSSTAAAAGDDALRRERDDLREQLRQASDRVSELSASHDRLEQLVVDQAATLAQLRQPRESSSVAHDDGAKRRSK